MIEIKNVDVYGWQAAIRGMRNSWNSWDKSDSFVTTKEEVSCDDVDGCCTTVYHCSGIGENDLDLMKRLVKAGTDHRKFMRMINVTMDIVAPLYWWAEYDTYKVGTVRNSCSKMHKITAKKFTVDDFSHEHLFNGRVRGTAFLRDFEYTIMALNSARNLYLQTKNKKYWWQIIQLLPSSYNQRATVLLNYEVLLNMYHARKNHKLDEWRTFCSWIETLPYMSEFLGGE